MDQLTRDLYLACVKARVRFAELNGQVSPKVWNDNYEAVHALDEAIEKANKAIKLQSVAS